ncbi:NACHT and WD repeat domain-containing protein 2-like [Mercenaria mercenaria]|uniref:NACHT and WD repeat domain-containing protein 2-like n=1 Tax=Mercenaria mercenaria TaxID=6596 RepID=UPI00234F3650|nr:NACHT and WD repeat domain-containing protein 2-like [Mercenaria mercenaria]
MSDWDPIVRRVLAGQVKPEELPEIPQRVVRVFLSSTGIDSQTERNTFVEKVYPKLRDYCSENYGVDFQVVDLEWGIPQHDQTTDPAFVDFRFKQLQKCHDLSAGPSFLAFIGQKYGDSPLPAIIPSHEYEALRVAMKGYKSRDSRTAPLLDEWYRKDDNSVPPAYILTSVREKLPDYFSADDTRRQTARTKWQEDEQEMKRMLQKAAEIAYLEGLIDGDTKQKYHLSTQDLLIQTGTEESASPTSRCVLALRTIVDLKNYVEDPKASEFTEVTLNEKTDMMEIDEICSTKLSQLKTRAKGLISDKNCLEYDVLWRYDDVINPKLHASYLNKLCTELFDTLKGLIDETVPKTKFDCEPELYQEVLQHWLNCKEKARNFYGQAELMTKLKNYLSDETTKPLVVYGEAGSGKSTLLSKLATEVVENSRGNTVCAIRFIGYTPKSSDIKQVLMTLCLQLLHTLGRKNTDIPYDAKDLQRYFNDLLNSVPKGITVVIFLDSLENLIPEYNAHFLSWLPNQLKPNIKIVVSTHPTKHKLLERLQSEVIKDINYMVGVTQMPCEDAEGLMQYILSLHSRKITSLQQNVFKSKFSECSLAMYVQLLTHQAKLLKSYDVLDKSNVPSNINEAINWYFDSLEKKHGKVLIGRTLGYLVASVTGLSDCEMEDLLSLDDDVLNSVFVTYHPPVRRIPFVKWLSIKDDVEPFLNYREADGVTVYMWCHEEFEAVVRERYLNDETTRKEVHSMLADYFLGAWAGKKKPVKVPTENGNLVLLPCGNEADRFIAAQPLSFETPGAPVRYNKRKYDQVPRHLYLAGRFKELNSLVLFNYEWLYNKIKALSLTHIMADFVLNPGEEATLVEEALRVAESTIQSDINNLAPEITGHLLPYYKTHPNIRALVQQCDTAGLKHCALIPNFPYLQVPGSSLQYTLTSQVCGDFYRLTFDDRYLLVKVKDSSIVHRYDVATGEAKKYVFASNGDLYVTPNGKLFVIVDHFTEKAIKIHNSETGEFVGQLIVMNHIELKVKDRYKMGAVSLTDERMGVIVTTDTSFLCIADLAGCQFLQIIGLDGKCDVCEISPNGRFVFCNSNEFILCYDIFSLEHICTVSAGYRPSSLAFTRDGFRAFVANPQERKLLVMHIHRGAVEMAYKTPLDEDMPDDKIVNLKVSRKDDMVLVQGLSNILIYNRFTEKVCAKFQRPEDVPKEFKLPKSHYTDLFFTNAEFSRDGNFVVASIFRNLYIWQISTGNRISTIQAPVGIITEMLISKHRSQVITHVKGSKDIQVWNIDEAVNQVHMLDKLTSAIEDVKLTSDNSVAYVKCQNSDELGVIDMRNGVMLDLLTHDSLIKDFACTPDGQYVIVSSKPKKRNAAVKIWDMDERKVVKEFGNTTGYCIGAHKNQAIIYVAQEKIDFKTPFYITKFSFVGDGFTENTHPLSLKYILDRPFLTNDDQNVVVLTAQDYIETEGEYDTPTICAFSLDDDYKVSYYTPESFQEAVNINTIKQVMPCKQDSNTIVVLYTTNAVVYDVNCNKSYKDQSQLGLLVLDINTGAINMICEPFLNSGTPINSIVFSDVQFCIDSKYNIFDINNGSYAAQLPDPGTPPNNLALFGNAVIYFKGSQLYVLSIVTGKQIAKCEVHSSISHIAVCSDQRTIVVGCHDGTIVSYILIDATIEDAEKVVSKVGSRSMEGAVQSRRNSRAWDKVENDSCPNYSRPPSALSLGPKEKVLLKQVKAAPKIRPNSDTLIYLNERSKTCNVQ